MGNSRFAMSAFLFSTLFVSTVSFAKSPYCVQKSDGSYSFDVVAKSGGDEDGLMWGEGGACIFRPLQEVWAVTHNQDVMKWEGVDKIQVQQVADSAFDVTHFYKILYTAGSIISVSWTMDWIHHFSKTTQTAYINYQKVDGTHYIKTWKGSIVLDGVTPTVTAFTMHNDLEATRTNLEDMKSTIREYVDKLRNGAPNWGAIPPQ